jgi:hypothetical protein
LKLEQERAGHVLELIGIGNDFLNRTQKAQLLREIFDKWNYMKLKSFCTREGMVTKLKRQPTEWEKIFSRFCFTEFLSTIRKVTHLMVNVSTHLKLVLLTVTINLETNGVKDGICLVQKVCYIKDNVMFFTKFE